MTSDEETIASLRFGLGPRPDARAESGPADMLRGLRTLADGPALVDEAADRALWAEVREVREARGDARSGGKAEETAFAAERKDLRHRLEAIQFASLARAAGTPHGFAERMARFWTDHFTVAVKFPGHWSRVAGYPDQAIRPHVAERFEDAAPERAGA